MKNKLRIEFTPLFNKQRKAAPLVIKLAFRDALDLFAENPNHPALRNHPLTGKYAGFRSIDVTEDWRALYREEKERIMFADLGSVQYACKKFQRPHYANVINDDL